MSIVLLVTKKTIVGDRFMKTTIRKLKLISLLLFIASLLTCGCGEFAHTDDANWQLKEGYDPNAIVLIAHIDHRQHETLISWPRVAFAVGDGTIIMTAKHCVDRPPNWIDPPMSPEIVVISPYYGDIYKCKVLAVEEETDLAVLEAPWPVHPALAIAKQQELKDAERVKIFSRPIRKSKEPHQLGQQIRTATFVIDNPDITEPIVGMKLKGTGPVRRGWSGSAMVLPESAKVAGVISALTGIKFGLPGLFSVIIVFDTVGGNVESIWELLEKNELELVAKSYYPSSFEPVADAQPAFSCIMDYFENLLKKDSDETLKITGKLVILRPESNYVRLILAIGADIQAHQKDCPPQTFLALAESNYQKALQLDPNNAFIHAAYGNFLTNRNRKRQALAQTESALAIDANNNLAAINRLMLLTQTEPERAEKYAEQLTDKDPNNPDLWFHYAAALSKSGENRQALIALQKAIELNPKGNYYGGFADILVELDRLKEAERYYKKMTKRCGCQRCWFNYANFLYKYRPKKLKQAEKALDKAEAKAHMLRVPEEDMAELRRLIQEKKMRK